MERSTTADRQLTSESPAISEGLLYPARVSMYYSDYLAQVRIRYANSRH